MLPHIFGEKIHAGYIAFASLVGDEVLNLKSDEKKKKVARLMISPSPPFDEFIKNDLLAHGIDDTTDQKVINDRMAVLATFLVNLGFGD